MVICDVSVTAEKLGINFSNWFIYFEPPSYGPTCGLLPINISESDKSLVQIEEQLYDKYYHKEPDRSKYTFKKLWTLEMSMKISALAEKAYKHNSN